jgi:hypothetical protein
MTTKSDWRKGLRSFMLRLRIAGMLILLVVAGMAVYRVYDIYRPQLGSLTTDKTIESYFMALGRGDHGEVYRLTSKTNLTDLYGRPITEGEFRQQLRRMTDGTNLPINSVQSSRIFEHSGSRFYRVTIHSTLGGQPSQSTQLVELRQEEGVWVVVYPFAILR